MAKRLHCARRRHDRLQGPHHRQTRGRSGRSRYPSLAEKRFARSDKRRLPYPLRRCMRRASLPGIGQDPFFGYDDCAVRRLHRRGNPRVHPGKPALRQIGLIRDPERLVPACAQRGRRHRERDRPAIQKTLRLALLYQANPVIARRASFARRSNPSCHCEEGVFCPTKQSIGF